MSRSKPAPEVDLSAIRISANELARMIGQNDRTVSRVLAASDLQRERGEGGYKLTEAIREIVKYYVGKATRADSAGMDDKARKLRAEADKAELEFQKKAGQLCYIADAEAIWKDGFAQIRTILESSDYIPREAKERFGKELTGIRIDPTPNADAEEN